MKAQSSVEFIMNYSWMLAIVGVVIAALFALGFFNQDVWGLGSGKSGFGDLAPMDGGWKVDENGTLFLKFRNNADADLKLWTVNANLQNVAKGYNYGGSVIKSGNDSSVISIAGISTMKKGDYYSININMTYGTADINFTSEGKVWGVIGS
jgi:hypothetical protein